MDDENKPVWQWPVWPEAELVFGLVAPVGVNFDQVRHRIARCLSKYGYVVNQVQLSQFTAVYALEQSAWEGSSKFVEINGKMDAGNRVRFASRRGDLLALAAAKAVHDERVRRNAGPLLRTVHVLRSLKHPDEVTSLRQIYGPGFFVLGVVVDSGQRRKYLADDLGCSPGEVQRLLQRDEHEERPEWIDSEGVNYGQRTRDTFHLADAFIRMTMMAS